VIDHGEEDQRVDHHLVQMNLRQDHSYYWFMSLQNNRLKNITQIPPTQTENYLFKSVIWILAH
jgi:hypothetical protein